MLEEQTTVKMPLRQILSYPPNKQLVWNKNLRQNNYEPRNI